MNEMAGSVLDAPKLAVRETIDTEAATPDAAAVASAKPSVGDFISALTEDQRKELARKLLGL